MSSRYEILAIIQWYKDQLALIISGKATRYTAWHYMKYTERLAELQNELKELNPQRHRQG